MTDIELTALTELVATERFQMEAENELRKIQGHSPAYSGDMTWKEKDRLREELERRQVI